MEIKFCIYVGMHSISESHTIMHSVTSHDVDVTRTSQVFLHPIDFYSYTEIMSHKFQSQVSGTGGEQLLALPLDQ